MPPALPTSTRNPDFTHDALRCTWVDGFGEDFRDFPLQNLPIGIFASHDGSPRPGLAIGRYVLDLSAAANFGLLEPDLVDSCRQSSLNVLMGAGRDAWRRLRQRASELLGADTCPAGVTRESVRRCLVARADAVLQLPAIIGDYTDFYASVHHATNVGRLFRPDNPLLPNYHWLPVGYHGRSSSIVSSDTPVRRPNGQRRPTGDAAPRFEPTRGLDFELEVGAFVGTGNSLGSPVTIAAAAECLFGVVLLNDWSARDIQAWEYQPLGPFLGKSFATTISPWIVSMDALVPFRTAAAGRAAGVPPPLPHLSHADDQAHGGIDLQLEAFLLSARMRAAGLPPFRLTRGNLQSLHWTFAQMIAHHTSNGCNLRPGDLLGSGTVSGPDPESLGCLLEQTRNGDEPLALPGGEQRRYLEDGDEIILRGWCERPGFQRIGLGECRGVVLPAP